MAKAGVTHDLTITPISGTASGFMMAHTRSGRRPFTVQDYRTIAPRQLSDAELSQAQFPVEVELLMFQEDWLKGIGGINHRLDSKFLADGRQVDTQSGKFIRLMPDGVDSTVDSNPSEYVSSGFTAQGDQLWSWIGREPYRWDFANKQWDKGTAPVVGKAAVYRSGVHFNGSAFCTRWADDAGSSGSYVAADEPCYYVHKTPTATAWTLMQGGGGTDPDSFKYMTVANNKLWGGYVTDAVDSSEDLVTHIEDEQSAAATSATSVTRAITPAGFSRLLLVGLMQEDGSPVDAATVVYSGDESLTKLGSVTRNNVHTEIWYLANPSINGASNVVATYGATVDSLEIQVYALSGVNATPLGSISTNGAAASTMTSTATAVVGDRVIDFVSFADHTGSGTVGSGQTQRHYSTSTGGIRALSSDEVAGSTSVVMNWTSDASADYASASVAVKPGAAAADTLLYTTESPSAQFSAGDICRVGGSSELMLVTAVSDSTPDTLTVVRGYRGTIAAASTGGNTIYKITENRHHVRASTDPTALSNWSSATTIGESGSPITALVGVDTDLIVCKTDGIYRVNSGGTVTELRPELKAETHADNFKGAFVWNDVVFLPLHDGGMWALETTDFTLSDISASLKMPNLTAFHGRVVAGHGDVQNLYILILDTSNTVYYIMRLTRTIVDGVADYRWDNVNQKAYTTSHDPDHAAVLLEAITGDNGDLHSRVWMGIESTGSNLFPRFIPHSDSDEDWAYSDDTSPIPYFITTEWDANLPNVAKRYQSITVDTKNLGTGGSDNHIAMQYRVDGGSWTAITGTAGTSKLTSSPQTISFGDGVTGNKIEFRGYLERGSTATATPEFHSITVTAQLRPSALKTVPLAIELSDQVRMLNGARESGRNAGLTNLRAWNTQGAEVTLVTPDNTSRDCVFLPGLMRETEEDNPAGARRPTIVVDVLLAEVG